MKKLLNKGFTIVELVIVIAVIGILAAVLIPTFSNVIESANETADLQEAQSTLKAYTAYMTSKGSPLTDGAVFKIEETGRTYVFYKGELHKFDATKESNTLSDDKVAPAVYVGKGIYACNKVFSEFVDGDQPGKTDDGYITFFYNDLKAIEFEDGSLKCSIYPGLVLACDNSFSNASPDYPEDTTTISVGTYKLFDKKINLDAITNTATIPAFIGSIASLVSRNVLAYICTPTKGIKPTIIIRRYCIAYFKVSALAIGVLLSSR